MNEIKDIHIIIISLPVLEKRDSLTFSIFPGYFGLWMKRLMKRSIVEVAMWVRRLREDLDDAEYHQ